MKIFVEGTSVEGLVIHKLRLSKGMVLSEFSEVGDEDFIRRIELGLTHDRTILEPLLALMGVTYVDFFVEVNEMVKFLIERGIAVLRPFVDVNLDETLSPEELQELWRIKEYLPIQSGDNHA